MLSFLLALAIAGAEPPAQQQGLDAANSWVGLIDSKRWDDSWSAAGTLFRSQMPQPRWATTISPVRGPLGAVSSRVLKKVTKSSSLPGAPDGEYEVVEFQTSFENMANATETVVLAREEAGWKVVGYFIR
ncbi:MAG: DUF4019 domain-containing protein [Sphingomonas sp.]|nr:DUF4019 domain-containing protein [Sphingomonas sp.]